MADKPSTMRCSRCEINYPLDKKVCMVDDCRQSTWRAIDEVHDTDWKERVSLLNRRVKRDGIDRIPDMSIDIKNENGQFFVEDKQIRAFGYLYSQSGDVIKVNGDYYEIFGAIHYGSEAAGWWIELIPIEGVFDAITPDDIINEEHENGAEASSES